MKKALQITNFILVLFLFTLSSILLISKLPTSLDSSLIYFVDIYLKFVCIISLIWVIMIVFSFFKTEIENNQYKASFFINLPLFISALLVIGCYLLAIWLPTILDPHKVFIIGGYGIEAYFIIAVLAEAPIFFYVLLFPLFFIISFITFLIGYFKNRRQII